MTVLGATTNGNGDASGQSAASAATLQGPSLIPTLPAGVFLYFYHPDHLGSTGYVTDNLGAVFQHEEYLPFGESWAEETTNKKRTQYLEGVKARRRPARAVAGPPRLPRGSLRTARDSSKRRCWPWQLLAR